MLKWFIWKMGNGSHSIIHDAVVGSFSIMVNMLWLLPYSIFVYAKDSNSCKSYNIFLSNTIPSIMLLGISCLFKWKKTQAAATEKTHKHVKKTNITCVRKKHIKCFHNCGVKHELVEGIKLFFWQLDMECERDGSVSKQMSDCRNKILPVCTQGSSPHPHGWHKNHGLSQNIVK